MITVIESGIPVNFQKHIEDSVYNLSLVYQPNTSYNLAYQNDFATKGYMAIKATDANIVDNGHFAHLVMDNGQIYSTHWGVVSPILYMFAEKAGIEVNEITRIRINLLIQDKEFTSNFYNAPHTDITGSKSFVYYVNDSDGDTVLFNEFLQEGCPIEDGPGNLTIAQRVSPKRGRGVFFEKGRYHTSSNPKSNYTRYVINFNFR